MRTARSYARNSRRFTTIMLQAKRSGRHQHVRSVGRRTVHESCHRTLSAVHQGLDFRITARCCSPPTAMGATAHASGSIMHRSATLAQVSRVVRLSAIWRFAARHRVGRYRRSRSRVRSWWRGGGQRRVPCWRFRCRAVSASKLSGGCVRRAATRCSYRLASAKVASARWSACWPPSAIPALALRSRSVLP